MHDLRAGLQGIECWMCGRKASEIRSLLDGEIEEETELEAKIKKTNNLRSTFVQTSNKWTNEFPSKFEDLDLEFIIQNPKQFGSIKFLAELSEKARSVLGELDELSYRSRRGDIMYLGDAPTGETSTDRTNMIKRIDEFEKKTGRSFRRERDTYGWERSDSPFSTLRGLKFREGVDFLVQAGLFSLDLQLDLLKNAKDEAKKKKPSWNVGAVKIKGYPREVPLCNVCEALLKTLHPVDYGYWDDDDPPHGSDDEVVYGDETNDLGGPENK